MTSTGQFWRTGLKPVLAQYGATGEEVSAQRNVRVRVTAVASASGVPRIGSDLHAVTRCGMLGGVTAGVNYPEGRPQRLVLFRVCNPGSAQTIEGGFSGGPVYRAGRACGLVSGTRGGTEGCLALVQDAAGAQRYAKVRILTK